MKEIGGYFGLEVFLGKEYHEDLLALNTARAALVYLIQARHIQKLYLPYFLCNSIREACERIDCKCEFYHVDHGFRPRFNKQLLQGEYVYIVNYYGQFKNEDLQEYVDTYHRVIIDNVQAFFQVPIKGIDTIYSCRKFFGVPDGAYLSTTARSEEILPIDVSSQRMKHLLGRFEGKASDFYGDFKANDKSFAGIGPRRMSELTHNLLRAIDYDSVIERRNENFSLLHAALGKANRLAIKQPRGAFAYPYYHENGMTLKKSLAERGIFVATLWPGLPCESSELEKDHAENILPLPCDQRYSLNDMKTILKMLDESSRSSN